MSGVTLAEAARRARRRGVDVGLAVEVIDLVAHATDRHAACVWCGDTAVLAVMAELVDRGGDEEPEGLDAELERVLCAGCVSRVAPAASEAIDRCAIGDVAGADRDAALRSAVAPLLARLGADERLVEGAVFTVLGAPATAVSVDIPQ